MPNLNLFSLHGNYFQDDENRFTANVLFILSEGRRVIFSEFLRCLRIDPDGLDLSKATFDFQSRFRSDSGYDIPDAEIRLGDEFHIVLEAKVGHNSLSYSQLRRYAEHLSKSTARVKRLVCVTQINEQSNFDGIATRIEQSVISPGCCAYIRWHEILELMRSALDLAPNKMALLGRRIRRGGKVDYLERIVSLFLQEVEQTMYDKKIIDELPSGDLADVVITTQTPWFMNVAKQHYIWFPTSTAKYGLSPAKYVAYYETNKVGNDNRKCIAHIAKNIAVWNRITADDARQIDELKGLFRNSAIGESLDKWGRNNNTFHIALTERPIRLKSPIPLGKRNVAKVLSKKRCGMVELMNARTIDDLF